MGGETKFTAGPWVTRGHNGWYASKEDDSGQTSSWGIGPVDRPDPVAIAVHDGDWENAEYVANARLIAAAPELYEACLNLLAISRIKYGNLDPDANAIFDRAARALAKVQP